MLLRNAKLKKKRKIDAQKPFMMSQSTVNSTSGKNDIKEVPRKKAKRPSIVDIETKDVDVMETEDIDDSDEDCAAKPCKQPTGLRKYLLYVIVVVVSFQQQQHPKSEKRTKYLVHTHKSYCINGSTLLFMNNFFSKKYFTGVCFSIHCLFSIYVTIFYHSELLTSYKQYITLKCISSCLPVLFFALSLSILQLSFQFRCDIFLLFR